MIVKDKTGREVEIEIDGSGDDAFAAAGIYVDDGTEADDDTLNEIQDSYAGEIAMEALERQIGQAEAHYEGDR
jgi:hypothetical protein